MAFSSCLQIHRGALAKNHKRRSHFCWGKSEYPHLADHKCGNIFSGGEISLSVASLCRLSSDSTVRTSLKEKSSLKQDFQTESSERLLWTSHIFVCPVPWCPSWRRLRSKMPCSWYRSRDLLETTLLYTCVKQILVFVFHFKWPTWDLCGPEWSWWLQAWLSKTRTSPLWRRQRHAPSFYMSLLRAVWRWFSCHSRLDPSCLLEGTFHQIPNRHLTYHKLKLNWAYLWPLQMGSLHKMSASASDQPWTICGCEREVFLQGESLAS